MNYNSLTKQQLIDRITSLENEKEIKPPKNGNIEANLEPIYCAIPIGIGIVKDRVIQSVNDNFCELLGYSKNELIGQSSRIVYTNDKEYERVGSAKYKDIKETGIGRIETKLLHKDGTILYTLVSSSPINKSDLSEGVVFTVQNISEIIKSKKKLEENDRFLEGLINGIQDGISVLDADLNIIMVNDVMKEWYTQKTPLVGKKCYNCYHNTEQPCNPCPSLRCLKSKKTERNEVPGYPGSDVEWIELFSYPIINPTTGKVENIVEFVRDITSRKKAKDELKESENKFRVLSETSPSGIMLFKNDKFIYTNPGAEKICGYNLVELGKMNFWDFVAPEHQETVKKRGRKRQNGFTAKSGYEFKIITKSGQEKWILLHGTNIIFKGEDCGLITIQNITDRKNSEIELERVNRALTILSEGNKILVHSNNEKQLAQGVCNCIIKSGNYPFAWIGYFQVENGRSVLPIAQSGFKRKLRDIKIDDSILLSTPITRTINTGEVSIINDIEGEPSKYMFYGEAIRLGYKSFISLPIKREKKTVGVLNIYSKEKDAFIPKEVELLKELTDDLAFGIVTLRDRQINKKTEAKLIESEERFRGLFENATIGLYRTSKDGSILMANPRLISMLGYSSFEELTSTRTVLSSYYDPDGRKIFSDLIEEEGQVYGFEQKWVRKDGKIIWIRESARVIYDDKGKPLYYEGTVEDITNIKLVELALIEAKDRAEKSDKLKSEFLAQMSHEIRTPINTMLNFAELLKEDVNSNSKEFIEEEFSGIENAGKRITRTIDLILNMSQIQTGTYEPTLTNFDLSKDVIERLKYEFINMAKSKGLQLNFVINTELSLIVADEYSVCQIFANLIDNAIKYTKEGVITISVFRNDMDQLQVEVADSGVGISEEFLPNLFEPFVQEHRGYSRNYEGNGLGLALVKNYCDINNATIEVESEKGKGTKFIITFENIT